jgi:hypothetical protein
MKNNERCPNCGSFNTESGRDNLLPDIGVGVIITIVSLGVGSLFWIPFMAIKGISGKYSEHIYRCHNCRYNWTA